MGKGKLVAGIILLIIGVGLIPASFGMNNLLEQRMDESISTSFYSVRENVLPYTYEIAYADATPTALLALKAVAEPDILEIINGSVPYYAIRDMLNDLSDYIGGDSAKDWFFNDPSFSTNTDGNYSIIGISEYSGLGNLSFTPSAMNNFYDKFGNYGHLGVGVNDFISDYEDAISDPLAQADMVGYYKATWEQISNVSVYLTDYIIPQIPTLGGFPFAAEVGREEDFFFIQWVNSSVVPGTWKLSVAGEDYEVWEYERFDLDLDIIRELWDSSNTSAPLNDEGIISWYRSGTNATLAAELTAIFDLTTPQYENLMLYFFNGNFVEDVCGPIFQDLTSVTVRNLAFDKIYLQWANGDIFPENISFINPLYEGFEVSFPPNSTGIDANTARVLWNLNTLNGFANTTGVHIWYELARSTEPDTVIYDNLMAEFGLTSAQMDALLDWVLIFRPSAINILNEQQELDYHPYIMKELLTSGIYIAAGIIGFIGLIFLITSFRKGR